jgi:hypothetical protein
LTAIMAAIIQFSFAGGKSHTILGTSTGLASTDRW